MKDRVVLITGAGKGSGRALAEALGARGARIAANDISPVNVEAAVATIVAAGGEAAAFVHDVARKVAVQGLVQEVQDRWGRIDVLINHAAVEPQSALLDMDEWDWHRVLDVNLTGAFLLMQSVGRMMRTQGGGVIINMITRPGPGVGNARAAFLASMGGLVSLSQQAAEELGPAGVRVHALEIDQSNLVEVVVNLCKG
ncbi:MAG TPA: SDR family NAD(P)-dependent oxidoreductase [Anaerolineales bacterium]|jgi:NAD(P)-dependent dehydrogenase (short-subunit alcohol dehydrogenase family)